MFYFCDHCHVRGDLKKRPETLAHDRMIVCDYYLYNILSPSADRSFLSRSAWMRVTFVNDFSLDVPVLM